MIEDLEREGLIRPLPIDPKRVRDALALARRDIGVARDLLPSSNDWAFTVAYNAVLQAGRALMFSKGYRPEGANQHVSVVRFCEEFLSPEDAVWFERMRRKRHQSVYDTAGSVSEREAENAVKKAEEIVQAIEAIIQGI
jgi:uncharacterized protein (UPF0332 family)